MWLDLSSCPLLLVLGEVEKRDLAGAKKRAREPFARLSLRRECLLDTLPFFVSTTSHTPLFSRQHYRPTASAVRSPFNTPALRAVRLSRSAPRQLAGLSSRACTRSSRLHKHSLVAGRLPSPLVLHTNWQLRSHARTLARSRLPDRPARALAAMPPNLFRRAMSLLPTSPSSQIFLAMTALETVV